MEDDGGGDIYDEEEVFEDARCLDFICKPSPHRDHDFHDWKYYE